MEPLDKALELLEDHNIREDSILRIVEVGSTAHGMSVPGIGDDFDATVVRMETFEELVLGPEGHQSRMIRTQPSGARSGPGDIDLNVYTLRKFVNLASGGNPSILGAIFSSKVHYDVGVDWKALGRLVASKKAGNAFLGYMTQQRERWQGDRGKKVNRPELVEKYGFDTKYAAHLIRLGFQGIEYMEKGSYSMPLPPDKAKFLIDLRTGLIPEAEAMVIAQTVEDDLRVSIDRSPLPPTPSPVVRTWVTNQYRRRVATTGAAHAQT